MGRLFVLDSHKKLSSESVDWVFSQEAISRSYGHDRVDIDVCIDYPHLVAIHYSDLRDMYSSPLKSLRLEIRRFIERRCEGDVVGQFNNRSYSVMKQDGLRVRRHSFDHGYFCMNFELIADATAFSLNFADSISECSENHPTHDEWAKEGYDRG